jgi:hypothetical protein
VGRQFGPLAFKDLAFIAWRWHAGNDSAGGKGASVEAGRARRAKWAVDEKITRKLA